MALKIELLSGPAIEVVLVSSSGTEHSWTLHKALLDHHSGYFRAACKEDTFIEGKEGRVAISGFDPDVFVMFVEFIYCGSYEYKDDLTDKLRIRDSAKAWVLGDYLDALEFKNFAMRNLHSIYMPCRGAKPKTGIGPKMVDYCCSKTVWGSRLYLLVRSFLVQNYHDMSVVVYSPEDGNRDEWDLIWEQHSRLRSDVLYYVAMSQVQRSDFQRELDTYLEPIPNPPTTA